MDEETVRIRLDLPKKLYHEARAEVERYRARNDPRIRNLSDLVMIALEKITRGEKSE
ncbi:MAG: hypothetical protein H5T49_03225 [Hadesarchaea archaeon]|nr:hypothetical protein [Hadesarchaea archaeon]